MDIWYVAVNGQQQGPFSQAFIQQSLSGGVYSQETLVWRQGFDAWQPIAQVPELLATSASPSPPHAADHRCHGR